MNFGPVTPEFQIGKDVHPVVSFFKIRLSDKLSQVPLDRFSPNIHRMAIFDRRYRFDPLFLIAQGKLLWQPILGLKMGEIGRLTFIHRLGVEYRHSDFNRFICDDLTTCVTNLVNFG